MAEVYRFVASDGNSQNRRQTSKACESCRRRKKRCVHGDAAPPSSGAVTNGIPASGQCIIQGALNTSPGIREVGGALPAHIPHSPAVRSNRPEVETAVNRQVTGPQAPLPQQGQNGDISDSGSHAARNSRFIGDLNPEGIFLAATSPDATRGASLNDSIGVWSNTTLNRNASQDSSQISQSPANLFYGSGSLVQNVLVPMLEQECRLAIPPPACLQSLSKIYFDKVYPIFPVVDESACQSPHLTKADRMILLQGICLAASKNFSASRYLVIGDETSPILSCREFGEKLSGAMRISIEIGLITNKIVTIQALALLSQFTDNPEGEDISSQLCARAVHQSHSLGLHIKGQDDDPANDGSTTLLCCIWAMDRMNAAFNGRPVSMHERDLRQDLEHCFERQAPCFRLFLEVIVLLDKVIDLYRPVAHSGDVPPLTWDFPDFEDVVLKCGSSNVGTTALATIEVLYHAIAILSCRSKSWADPERSSTAFLRQSLSTSILISTVSRTLHDQLVLFPFVPYSMSLSMSIAYREMRHSKLPTHRARSRAQFQTICDGLSELQLIFWSASTTSEMGKKLLKEMDRVFSSVSSAENMRPQHNLDVNLSSVADTQNAMPGIPAPVPLPMDFNPSLFDSVSNVDLFGMFDPAFDLDGFDACLEGNLNPAFPSGLQ